MTISEMIQEAKEIHERKKPFRIPEDLLSRIEFDPPEKEREFFHFISSVLTSRNRAYIKLQKCRIPDEKRPNWLQRMYDRQTDEEIFASHFASLVKKDIEDYGNPEKNYLSYFRFCLLKEDELREYILQEFPFVKDYWGQDL